MKTLKIAAVIVFSMVALSASALSQPIPPQNHQISLADAKRYIQNYRNNPNPDPAFKGGFFWREIFDKILAQPGCAGIRYYSAKMDNGTPAIVLIGVDSNNKDIENGIIGEVGQPCPPYCNEENILSK